MRSVSATPVRSCLGADQHRVRYFREHRRRHRLRRRPDLRPAPPIALRRRPRASGLGAGQHRGRLAQMPRLSPRAERPAPAARAAQRALQAHHAAQRHVDPLQLLPREAPAAV